MKIRTWLLLAAAAGGVAAYLKQQQTQPAADEGIWKPVDPLRPFGDRDDESPSESTDADDRPE